MKSKVIIMASLLGILGGFIWLIFGSMLASTPPGVQGVSFRNASDFNPTSGTGSLLLGLSMIGIFLSLKQKGWGEKIGSVLFLVGSLSFFIGTMIRIDLNGEFEPAKPIGYILCILGLLIFAITVLRSKNLPKYTNLLFLIGSISLLLFNDQYVTAWASVPYGLSWIIIHIIIIRDQLKSRKDVSIVNESVR